jgi:hypothetical protein
MDGIDNKGQLSSSIDSYTSRDEVITTSDVYREVGYGPSFDIALRHHDVYYRP